MYIPSSTGYWEAIAGGLKAISSAVEMLLIYSDGTYSEIYGSGGTGTDMYLYCNEDDFEPYLQLRGAAETRFYLAADKSFELYDVSTLIFRVGHLNNNYHISVKNTTNSPPTQAGFGLLYCKADNKLYFRDGGGTEHTVAFV